MFSVNHIVTGVVPLLIDVMLVPGLKEYLDPYVIVILDIMMMEQTKIVYNVIINV